jgi:hypothetical protein
MGQTRSAAPLKARLKQARNQTHELTQTVDHSARPGSDCPRQSPGSNRCRLEQVRISEARRFYSERRSVEEKLRQLDECNQRLAGFLEKAAKLHDHGSDIDTCSPRLRIRFAAPLETIRHGVSRVHRVLARSWCQAHRVHEAGLLLEQRLVRRRRTNCTRRQPSAAGSVSCFGVCILLEPVPTWYDTEISLDDETGCGVE